MTRRLIALFRAERGSVLVEFAFVAPVLALMMLGLIQLGLLFGANAGLQHAVGEGARYATLYPAPSNAQITERVLSREFGLREDFVVGPEITRGLSDGTKYIDVTMSYDVPLNFVLFEGPAVRLTETRRAFTP